jgi:uncharacterized protein YkwD
MPQFNVPIRPLVVAIVVVILCLTAFAGLALPVYAQSTAAVFMPFVSTAPHAVAKNDPVLRVDGCVLSSEEAAVATQLRDDARQGRSLMVCDPILAQVARARAADMAQRAYFGHTDPDGYGPNFFVRQAGFLLPEWYAQGAAANNVESIGAGFKTAEAVWAGWMKSPPHITHLLGLDPFYADQPMYGVGHVYVAGSPYGHYWVVLTAPQPQ